VTPEADDTMLSDEARLLGRGISFPPRLGPDGRWATSAGTDNVRESIRVILTTELGERLMLPEFGGGLESFLFHPNAAPTHRLIRERVVQALGRWEPRIVVEDVAVEAAPDDLEAAVATVRYRLVVTRATEQVRLRVRLGANSG